MCLGWGQRWLGSWGVPSEAALAFVGLAVHQSNSLLLSICCFFRLLTPAEDGRGEEGVLKAPHSDGSQAVPIPCCRAMGCAMLPATFVLPYFASL